MRINNDYEIIRKNGTYTLYKDGNAFNKFDEETLEVLYKKLLIAPAQNKDRNEVFNAFISQLDGGEAKEELPDDTRIQIALEQLISFFTEFNFTPSFRFVNTMAHMSNKKKYISHYFSLMGSPYAEDIAAKIKSEEFQNILNLLAPAKPTHTINNRFRVYYGAQGTGKTTKALKETNNLCIVCNSSMLPADPNDPFSVFYHAMRYRDTTPELQGFINNTLEQSFYNVRNTNIESYTRYMWERITGTNYDEYLKEHTSYVVVEGEGERADKSEEALEGAELGKPHDEANKRDDIPNPFNFTNRLVARDDNFTKAIAILFDNFNKKTQGGSTYQTYSGVINPRNIAREDYRYFDRLAKQTGNNKFGSLHLNLFLDVSGSFYYNQKYTNQILKALCEMEDRYSYFTFDVIACGVGQQLLPRHDRAIQCEGGTYLTRDIEQLFHKMQKPQTMNYNIMLYDGDCEPDQNVAGKANAFGVLDKPNCFIISDPENEIYIKRAVHSAKTIISTNYKKELKDNILKALQLALS